MTPTDSVLDVVVIDGADIGYFFDDTTIRVSPLGDKVCCVGVAENFCVCFRCDRLPKKLLYFAYDVIYALLELGGLQVIA